jgi:tetratricopeptide (TPR) repeat protein
VILARRLQNQAAVADALRSLGWAELRQGAYGEAEAHAQESLAIFQTLGDRIGAAKTADLLGAIARESGDYERALGYQREAQALLQGAGAPGAEAVLLNNMGEVARAMGDYALAQRYYQQSGERSAALDDLLSVQVASLNLGHTAAALGDDAEARARFHEALRLAREMNVVPVLLDALAGLAGVLARTSQVEQALEILGAIHRHPSLTSETRPAIEQVRTILAGRYSAQQIEAGLACGESLPLEQLVSGLQSQ